MKKILLFAAATLVVLIIVAVIVIPSFMDTALKRGIEAVGSKMTKVNVTLDSASLAVRSGSGTIKGLAVANPEGYKTPSAIKVGSATLGVAPKSLFSDKVIVNTVNVEGPEVTFETDLHGNNLSKIMSNLEETTGGGKQPQPETGSQKAGKKLQVNEFIITGGKVHVTVNTPLGGNSATVALPEIRLKDLGTGPEGITAAELTKQVLQAVLNNAVQAAGSVVTDLSKGAAKQISGQAQGAVTGAVQKATEGLGGFLKKKK